VDLLVLAKEPIPGRVKTRLCPPCTPAQAAELATAALADTLAAACASGADRVVVALDGRPGAWLPAGVTVVDQGSGGLDRRLAAAWGHARGPALQIGMDTPQLRALDLDAALARLAGPGADTVFGPALDGGWWAVGMRRPDPTAFLGVPTSRADTGARQRRRLAERGRSVHDLPARRDVDDIADARAVAAAAPATAFATAFARLGLSAARPGDEPGADRSDLEPPAAPWAGDRPGVDRSRGARPTPEDRTGADRPSGERAIPEDRRPAAARHRPDPRSPLSGRHHVAAAGLTALLQPAEGGAIDLPVERWRQEPTPGERALLATLPSPVLDVGCGPGRLVAALIAAGSTALGIDPAPAAVAETEARGGVALCRSVFDPLPGEGRWAAVLLLDGNIGIGGDPVALLARIRALLRPGGVAVVEVEAPDVASDRLRVRLRAGDGCGPWFPWARLSVVDVARTAAGAGLRTEDVRLREDRWFARLVAP
jgi:glycosyltransferase A (GT-A) superfamily protein (DUF2064 family)/SAM-dependent methyltransferase